MITIDYDDNIFIEPDYNRLNKEFMYYLNAKGKNHGISQKNYIIKCFQQDVFYKNEIELFKDENVRNFIILNRSKFLKKNPEDLTSEDILNGFKRSGLYWGYSHFNPLWFKWFINYLNIKTCYDPCGGWGHRLLGALDLDLYIYNDISKRTYENVNHIIDYFELECITKTYNEDCTKFEPKEDYEAIFTCPPYYNLEKYEVNEFTSIEEYNSFLLSIFNLFYKKESCKYLGIVIREDLIPNNDYVEKYDLLVHKSRHLIKNTDKKNNEYLYIWKK